MTRSEILKRIDEIQIELGIYKAMLTPPKPRKPRKVKDYTKEINEYVKKWKLK